jgi:NAD+ synthase (glutamine-hydrolysing)
VRSAQERFARATAMGLWDYLRKSRSQGFVLSLSGGADSAACAVLVHLACEWALEERGEDLVRQDLSHIPDLPSVLDARALCGHLLLCAYQATRNSGTTTLEAARTVAQGTGARFVEWSVDELVQGYLAIGQAALGRALDWSRDDHRPAEHPGPRAGPRRLAARQRDGLRCSSPPPTVQRNAAVGYATMDGDTSAVRTQPPSPASTRAWSCCDWLARLERDMDSARPRRPSPPSRADQRPRRPPPSCDPARPEPRTQTDEADLMPYPLLSRSRSCP